MIYYIGSHDHVRQRLDTKSWLLARCMPLPATTYDADYGHDTLLRFGAVDPDTEYEKEAA